MAVLAPAGSYHVSVRHRNHLGAMTAAPLGLSTGLTTFDFSGQAAGTYGAQATKSVGNVNVLWSGNVFRDGLLKYVGAGNDRDPILVRVGSTVPTNVSSGYFVEDVTLDGQVKYVGAGNDRDPVLVNVGSTVPTNTRANRSATKSA